MPSSKKPTTNNPEPLSPSGAQQRRTRRTAASVVKPAFGMAEQRHLEIASSREVFDFLGDDEDSDSEVLESGNGHIGIPKEASHASKAPGATSRNSSGTKGLGAASRIGSGVQPLVDTSKRQIADGDIGAASAESMNKSATEKGLKRQASDTGLRNGLKKQKFGPSSLEGLDPVMAQVIAMAQEDVQLEHLLSAYRLCSNGTYPNEKGGIQSLLKPYFKAAKRTVQALSIEGQAEKEPGTTQISAAGPSDDHGGLPLPIGDEVSYYVADREDLKDMKTETYSVRFCSPAQKNAVPIRGDDIYIETLQNEFFKGCLNLSDKTGVRVVTWVEDLPAKDFRVCQPQTYFFTQKRVRKTYTPEEWKAAGLDAHLARTEQEVADAEFAAEAQAAEYADQAEDDASSDSGDESREPVKGFSEDSENSDDSDEDGPESGDARIAKRLQRKEYSEAGLDFETDFNDDESEDSEEENLGDGDFEPQFDDGILDDIDEEIITAPGDEDLGDDLDSDPVSDDDEESDASTSGNNASTQEIEAAFPITGEILRGFLDKHKNMCDNFEYKDFNNTPRDKRPLAMSLYLGIRRTEVNRLLDFYMERLTGDGIVCLAKGKDMTLQDIERIKNDGTKEMLKAVYANAMRGSNSGEVYTGSTPTRKNGAKNRIAEHRRQIQKKVSKGAASTSAHYRFARQPGVRSSFRMFATFSNDTQEFYVAYLEAILMVWLNTYQRPKDCPPSFYGHHNPRVTYEWVEEMRRSHPQSDNLPNLGIVGTNRAWAGFQGFSMAANRTPSECVNPNCKTMTLPGKRSPYDPGMPLGNGFLCPPCYRYRLDTGKMRVPTAFHVYNDGDRCTGPNCSEIYKKGISKGWAKGQCRRCANKTSRSGTGLVRFSHVIGQKCANADCSNTFEKGKSWSKGMCNTCAKRERGKKPRKEKNSSNANGEEKKVPCKGPGCSNIYEKAKGWARGLCPKCQQRERRSGKPKAERQDIFTKVGQPCKGPGCSNTYEKNKGWARGLCKKCQQREKAQKARKAKGEENKKTWERYLHKVGDICKGPGCSNIYEKDQHWARGLCRICQDREKRAGKKKDRDNIKGEEKKE